MNLGSETESPFGEPTGDISDIDVDALESQIESGGNTERPMSAPSTVKAPTTPATQVSQDIEFTWNGKQIKTPLNDPRIKQWASQGYDYAQRMAEFNRQQTEFQTKSKKIQEYESKYQPVEEYVTKNPDWWKHVNDQWQKEKTGTQGLGDDPNNPIIQKLSAYEQELSGIKEFIQSQQAEKAAQKATQEDAALSQEIQTVRDAYKDLDWNTLDQNGKSLELKVLEHATSNGISKFAAAFKDLMHEELIKRAEERGKENVVKERQKQTKLGLLGKTPAPSKGITQAEDIKNKSYDQLLREGMLELGIG